jgi:phosphoribosylformylglycinamidine synthase
VIRLRVLVSLKPSVFDPQGKTTLDALSGLGFTSLKDLRQGKSFELAFDGIDETAARAQAADIATRVLSNPVIESFRVEKIG